MDDQEDRYYEVKRQIQIIFGFTPTPDQMNTFFFQVIEPLYQKAWNWKSRHAAMVAAISVLKNASTDEVEVKKIF